MDGDVLDRFVQQDKINVQLLGTSETIQKLTNSLIKLIDNHEKRIHELEVEILRLTMPTSGEESENDGT